MNKRIRGAFAMVLAGAFTFSAANALLATPTVKRLVKEHALTITGDYKKQDIISQAGKTAKDQPSPKNSNDVQTNSSTNEAAFQRALNNTANQQKTETVTKSTTANPTPANAKTTTTPATAPTPAITPAATTTHAPTTTATSAPAGSNPATATANHGQQVSQDAKENAASRQDQKVNNGKNL